jgi:hypothetical protein
MKAARSCIGSSSTCRFSPSLAQMKDIRVGWGDMFSSSGASFSGIKTTQCLSFSSGRGRIVGVVESWFDWESISVN